MQLYFCHMTAMIYHLIVGERTLLMLYVKECEPWEACTLIFRTSIGLIYHYNYINVISFINWIKWLSLTKYYMSLGRRLAQRRFYPVWLSVSLSICLSVHLFSELSWITFPDRSVCLSACWSVCLSVCLSTPSKTTIL